MSKIIFRCNGNRSIGYGHFIRSFALAGKVDNGKKILFCCSSADEFVRKQLSGKFELLELSPSNDNSTQNNDELIFDMEGVIEKDDLVVLDGYLFGTNYRNKVKEFGAKVFCIDDLPFGIYKVDAILNGDPLVTADEYKIENHVKFFLGIEYILLREEFFTPFKSVKGSGILIMMGGSDIYDLSAKYIEQGLKYTSLQINVVLTSGNNPLMIKAIVDKYSYNERVTILKDLKADQLVSLMDSVEYAIVPCSGVLMECLKRRVKPIFGFYADNQKRYFQYMEIENIGYNLGDMLNDGRSIDSVETYPFNEKKINILSEKIGSANFKKMFDEIHT